MKYENFAITVSELNSYIKEKISDDEVLKSIVVKGEISNFKKHYTGHLYFSLKDENSLIKCIMFKSYAQKLEFEPKEGDKVYIFGNVDVYERDGVYQLYANFMKEDGVGDLYKKYQKLKSELEEKGYFDNKYKKKIPYMPKTIGVLTSQTGSVIRDIINVSLRRNPNVNIRLFPVPVQGEGAAEKIVHAIKVMNEKNLADVLILARGGGSLEDLWPFNEEILADAIFESKIPIISAVGHETDFSISDFVADLRAPTPSAAAELAVLNMEEIRKRMDMYKVRLKDILKHKLEIMKARYNKCLANIELKNPLKHINYNYLLVNSLVERLEKNILNTLYENKNKCKILFANLDALSPLKTLNRGYSLIEKDGQIIKKMKNLKREDVVDIRFADGNVKAKIL